MLFVDKPSGASSGLVWFGLSLFLVCLAWHKCVCRQILDSSHSVWIGLSCFRFGLGLSCFGTKGKREFYPGDQKNLGCEECSAPHPIALCINPSAKVGHWLRRTSVKDSTDAGMQVYTPAMGRSLLRPTNAAGRTQWSDGHPSFPSSDGVRERGIHRADVCNPAFPAVPKPTGGRIRMVPKGFLGGLKFK